MGEIWLPNWFLNTWSFWGILRPKKSQKLLLFQFMSFQSQMTAWDIRFSNRHGTASLVMVVVWNLPQQNKKQSFWRTQLWRPVSPTIYNQSDLIASGCFRDVFKNNLTTMTILIILMKSYGVACRSSWNWKKNLQYMMMPLFSGHSGIGYWL